MRQTKLKRSMGFRSRSITLSRPPRRSAIRPNWWPKACIWADHHAGMRCSGRILGSRSWDPADRDHRLAEGVGHLGRMKLSTRCWRWFTCRPGGGVTSLQPWVGTVRLFRVARTAAADHVQGMGLETIDSPAPLVDRGRCCRWIGGSSGTSSARTSLHEPLVARVDAEPRAVVEGVPVRWRRV